MEININWNKPYIDKEEVFSLTADSINTFYTEANDFDKSNLFFVLLNSFNRMEEEGNNKEAAFLAFNIAYYLFILLTPPASEDLALYYINKAIQLDKEELYFTWKTLIEKGN